jgi:hypothetical protein
LGDQTVQLGGAAPDGKIPFPLMTKGERFIICIGQRHDSRGRNGHIDAEDRGMVSRGSMSDMTSVLHDMISALHQSVSINAKGGDC